MEKYISKRFAVVLSIFLFIVLCGLLVCEIRWPEAGVEFFLKGLLNR